MPDYDELRRRYIRDALKLPDGDERREAIERAYLRPINQAREMCAVTEEYVTKDSGDREVFSTGMQRDTTTGKPRWDLVAPVGQPLEQTMGYRHARLMARGAEKYGDRNWEKAATQEELDRFRQSAYRHFMQWFHGHTDEDHAAAVYFNIAGAEYVKGQL